MKRFVGSLLVFLLHTGLALAQSNNPIVLDGQGGNIDDIIMDIVMDQDMYHLKNISIKNVYYDNFGTQNPTGYVGANSWFKESETHVFRKTPMMRTNNFDFWFHPVSSDRMEES